MPIPGSAELVWDPVAQGWVLNELDAFSVQ